ncbi:MAG: exosortase-associated EpsI family protein [Kiritimatiellales bacterium]|nr:exosortase-associated EpsI family protein [Kiritimatiellota bacterium]MBL7012485.1 exosortase-associated EpsI family protein [Kiritimatiellales bacterium]
MEIRSFSPHLILIGLMALTALALAFTVDVTLSDQAGVRMELPAQIDEWAGDELRYTHDRDNPKQYRVSELELPDIDPETGEKLYTMSYAEYEALPHDTEFRKSIYTNNVDGRVFVSIVLSGRERDSIHRPQRCLVGQGLAIVDTERIEIPLAGREPLKADVLKTERRYRNEAGEMETYYGYYAYWFVGQNRETPSHYERMFWLAWDRVVHSVAHRWAYIAVSGRRDGEESEEYKQEIIDFVKKLYPHLLLDSPQNGHG